MKNWISECAFNAVTKVYYSVFCLLKNVNVKHIFGTFSFKKLIWKICKILLN